jgi:hypothetical protein
MNLPQIRFPRIQQRTVANHSVSTYRTHFPTTWPIPPTQLLLSPCDTCSHHLSCGPICGSRYVHTAGFFHAPHKKMLHLHLLLRCLRQILFPLHHVRFGTLYRPLGTICKQGRRAAYSFQRSTSTYPQLSLSLRSQPPTVVPSKTPIGTTLCERNFMR